MNNILAKANDDNLRFNGSSGGVVSQIIINHLNQGWYVVVPQFNQDSLLYEPKLIDSTSNYEQSGSVYQAIDTVNFIKKMTKLPGNYLVTCLPCEVKSIQNIFFKENLGLITIALACSGQLKYGATEVLFNMLNIHRDSIRSYKYRGGGWPGGIQVYLKNGKVIKSGNLESPWYDIFNSHLFTLRKCFSCNDVFGRYASITAADPWLPQVMSSETIGKTLLINRLESNSQIHGITIDEEICEDKIVYSQRYTLIRKNLYKKYKLIVKLFLIIRPSIRYIANRDPKYMKIFRVIYITAWKIIGKL